MKKLWLVILIFAIIAFLSGIPVLAEGIAQRGVAGVNYGRVLFPLIIGILAFCFFRKKDKQQKE